MISFLWSFPLSRLDKSREFPQTLVLLPEEIELNPSLLTENEVWLVADTGAGANVLFGRVEVTTISTIDEGIDEGRYLVGLHLLRSFRILPYEQGLDPWRLNLSVPHGVTLCPEKYRAAFLDLLEANAPRAFRPPGAQVLSSIKIVPPDSSGEGFGRNLFQLALRRGAFGDLNRWQKYKAVGPFGALALAKCIQLKAPDSAAQEIIRLDSELSTLLAPPSEPLLSKELPSSKPPAEVDMVLVKIDPEDIVTRVYQSSSGEEVRPFSTEKVQAAEERHQAMLRDIVEYTSSIGCVPLASRSIDLSYMLNDGVLLIEVKSGNSSNFFSQLEKGLIQVVKYELALEEEKIPVVGKFLVIESVPDFRQTDFAEKLGKKIRVTVDVYRGDLPWPLRLPKLMESLRKPSDVP